MHNKKNYIMEEHSKQLPDKAEVKRERHIATTGWLYLVVLANIALCLDVYSIWYKFYGPDAPDYYSYDYYSPSTNPSQMDLYIRGVMHIAFAVFGISLLNWKKYGFWGICIFTCIPLLFKIDSGMEDVTTYIYTFFGVGILYLFLQVKKNGKSVWSQLS